MRRMTGRTYRGVGRVKLVLAMTLFHTTTRMNVEPPASIRLLLSRAEDHRSEVFSDEQDLFSFGSQHKIEMADSEDTRNYHGRPGAMRVYGSGSRERLWEDRPVHAGGILAGHAAATVDGERPDRGNREPHTR